MKPTYILKVEGDIRPAIADVVWFTAPFSCYVITRINVPHGARGHGHGTTLLREILADADADQHTLALAPEASDGLTQDQIVAWYERHGFSWTRSGAMMERGPRA